MTQATKTFVASGVIHLALAGTALLGLLLGALSGGSNTEAQLSATLLDAPFGHWLLGLLGLTMVGAGLFQLVKGVRASFRSALKLGEMSPREHTWAVHAGRARYVARGVVFALVGVFFIQTARQADASEARGLDGALETLRGQPYGPWLLAAVALGFVLYGVHMGVEARYRNIYAE